MSYFCILSPVTTTTTPSISPSPSTDTVHPTRTLFPTKNPGEMPISYESQIIDLIPDLDQTMEIMFTLDATNEFLNFDFAFFDFHSFL